ncbi:MAG TPA: energy transducer TonB [Edaphobacter sp.]
MISSFPVTLLLIGSIAAWSLSPRYTFTANGQTVTSQEDTNKQPKQAKSSPRPNPDASGIYHTGDAVTAPKLIYQVMPEFSEKARKHKISGNIIVQVVVDTEGHVQDARVFRSAAEDFTSKKDREIASTLDPKAVEAVRQYKFEPGSFHGKPVPVKLNFEINFFGCSKRIFPYSPFSPQLAQANNMRNWHSVHGSLRPTS